MTTWSSPWAVRLVGTVPAGSLPSGEADLAPWTLDGALAGREALLRVRAGARVVVGTAGIAYRCPPAVFDLAARLRQTTGARVDLFHPWPEPLAPFGASVSQAFTGMLTSAGVSYHGGFQLAAIGDGTVSSAAGAVLEYDLAVVVPPHQPPGVIQMSPLAGPGRLAGGELPPSYPYLIP